MVIGVEVALALLEDRLLACVNHWLAQSFRVAGLPVRASIVVRQIGDEEPHTLNLDAQPVIDQPGLRIVVQTLEVEAGLGHRWPEVLVHDPVQPSVTVLHRHEGVASAGCSSEKLLVSLPASEGERDIRSTTTTERGFE